MYPGNEFYDLLPGFCWSFERLVPLRDRMIAQVEIKGKQIKTAQTDQGVNDTGNPGHGTKQERN